jgi:hypothetical protein
MSELATILNYAVTIEKKLEDLGATGIGIKEKVTSIENKIDINHKRLIRKVSFVRNKAAHEYNYQCKNIEEFTNQAETVIGYLNSLSQVNTKYNYSKKCNYPEDKTKSKTSLLTAKNIGAIESFSQTLYKFFSTIIAIVFILLITFSSYNSGGIGGSIFGFFVSSVISIVFINIASRISLSVTLFIIACIIVFVFWGVKV